MIVFKFILKTIEINKTNLVEWKVNVVSSIKIHNIKSNHKTQE